MELTPHARLLARFSTCDGNDGEAAVCASLGGLVGPLELVAVLGGAAAAIAGATAAAATGRARWFAGGMAIALALVGLLWFLVAGQQATLA